MTSISEDGSMTSKLPEGPPPKPRDWTLGLDMVVKGDSVGDLDRALSSAAPLVDQVTVLVDRRFGDKAETVAKWHGAHVLSGTVPMFARKEADGFDHIHFAAARNILALASDTDWYLVIDADEVMTAGDLLDAIARADAGDFQAVAATAHIQGDGDRSEVVTQPRVFLRKAVKWRHPIHEQARGIKRMLTSTARISTSYAGKVEARAARTRPALLKMLELPAPAPLLDHARFYLAKTAAMIGDSEAVIEHCAAMSAEALRNPRLAVMWAWDVEARLRLKGQEAAESRLQLALQQHPNYDALHYLKTMFSAIRWSEAARDPDYLHSSSPSRRHLAGFGAAAKALGWPIRMEEA